MTGINLFPSRSNLFAESFKVNLGETGGLALLNNKITLLFEEQVVRTHGLLGHALGLADSRLSVRIITLLGLDFGAIKVLKEPAIKGFVEVCHFTTKDALGFAFAAVGKNHGGRNKLEKVKLLAV